MDRAHSVFLGTIVYAKDCDRSSYKELCLQCAVEGCGAPVFLAEGEQQTKHLRHFPGRGKADCEERAKRTSPQKWERKRRSIEHQFMRELQANFWGIFNGVYIKMNLAEAEKEAAVELKTSPTKEHWTAWLKAVRSNKEEVLQLARKMCDALADGNYTVLNQFDPIAQKHNKETEKIVAELQRQTQRNSVAGALSFLLQPRNEPMLQTLFLYAISDYASYAEKQPMNFPPPITKPLTQAFYLWILTDLIGMLASIPWAKASNEYRANQCIPTSMQNNIRARIGGIEALALLNAPAIFK